MQEAAVSSGVTLPGMSQYLYNICFLLNGTLRISDFLTTAIKSYLQVLSKQVKQKAMQSFDIYNHNGKTRETAGRNSLV